MSKLELTLACADYDYLQPLRDGRVQAQGIDLNLLNVECGTRHGRMLDHGAYDAAEFSMGTYLVARSREIDRFQALPFFTRRMFVHRFCFVRTGAGIEKPADLKGRRIGLLSYQNSLAIFFKAMLMHSYGIAPTEVTWVTTGKERVKTELPPGIKIERAEAGRSLEALLLAGEIDALVEPDLPHSWLEGDGRLSKLFPDSDKEERSFFEANRIFPIMHPLVVKKEILDRDPWVAMSLYEAFAESRSIHSAWMRQPHRLSLVWPQVEKERTLFGRDPFGQGLAANRGDVDAMIQYASEQGLLARRLTPEELFAPGTRET